MQLPLCAVAAALALVVGMSRSDVSAAVLPDRSSSTESTKVPASNARTRGGTNRPAPHAWCTPWFSGLVQTIKKNKQPGIVWKAVSTSELGTMDGVKATNIGKGAIASLEPDLEWFVAPTNDGLYELTSGMVPSYCGSSFEHISQTALSTTRTSSCATPHVFAIRCASCDRHSDSATGCLLQSRTRDQCVELNEHGKLSWGECKDLFDQERGWLGADERSKRRARQSWDIVP